MLIISSHTDEAQTGNELSNQRRNSQNPVGLPNSIAHTPQQAHTQSGALRKAVESGCRGLTERLQTHLETRHNKSLLWGSTCVRLWISFSKIPIHSELRHRHSTLLVGYSFLNLFSPSFFPDSQFPIDISSVKRDHDFLDRDLVEPLCRYELHDPLILQMSELRPQ